MIFKIFHWKVGFGRYALNEYIVEHGELKTFQDDGSRHLEFKKNCSRETDFYKTWQQSCFQNAFSTVLSIGKLDWINGWCTIALCLMLFNFLMQRSFRSILISIVLSPCLKVVVDQQGRYDFMVLDQHFDFHLWVLILRELWKTNLLCRTTSPRTSWIG